MEADRHGEGELGAEMDGFGKRSFGGAGRRADGGGRPSKRLERAAFSPGNGT